MKKYFEVIFDSVYLIFDFVCVLLFFMHASVHQVFYLYGLLAFVLGAGDAFHLVPRIIKSLKGESEKLTKWLGAGMQISSITMTVFYIILYYIWKSLFGINVSFIYPAIIWISAIARILLCLMPQNNWYSKEGNQKWGIIRNVPFIFIGITMYILFLFSGNSYGYHMQYMSLAILVSFLCYFPVVLYVKKNPAVGMLMIPKTLAYVSMLALGLSLLTKF